MSRIALPGYLFDTYALYKKSTAAVVQWLSLHSGKGGSRAHLNSTKELIYLTEIVVRKKIKVPNYLLQIIRRAIRARTRVGQFFKNLAASNDDGATSSHEYFTSVLQQVHNDLCKLAEAACEIPTTPELKQIELNNTFEYLQIEDCLESDDQTPCTVCENRPRVVSQKRRSKHAKNIKKDYVNEFMVLSSYLLELDRLATVTKRSWKSAAAGSIPLAVAATTASMTYHLAKDLEKDLDEYGILDPDDFFTRYSTCVASLNLGNRSSASANCQTRPEFTLFSDENGLQRGWVALKDFRERWRSDASIEQKMVSNSHDNHGKYASTLVMDNPADFFSIPLNEESQTKSSQQTDRTCMDLILQRMGQILLLHRSKWLFYTPSQSPLIIDLAGFLQIKLDDTTLQRGKPRRPLSLSFGLQMVVESYKGWFDFPKRNELKNGQEQISQPVRKCCRVQSLQFAARVSDQILHLMTTKNPPCGCLTIDNKVVLDDLQNFQVMLNTFVNTVQFDIFYQAPWTCGQHIWRNLYRASDVGAKTWHHAYTVGTVLYIYHCLILLEVITRDQVPLFEHLCDLFEDSVFLGQRPSRNLFSCYERWSGGSLDFKQGQCKAIYNHHGAREKKWKMKFVKDVSQGGDHPIRGFDPRKISLFSYLGRRDFILDDDVLTLVHCSKNWTKTTNKDNQEAREKFAAGQSKAHTVELIQEMVLDEFVGEFPIAKINYSAIYEICVDILVEINRVEHAGDGDDPINICSCLTERLLQGADEFTDDLHIVKSFPHPCLLQSCKDGILNNLGNTSLSDFQWQL